MKVFRTSALSIGIVGTWLLVADPVEARGDEPSPAPASPAGAGITPKTDDVGASASVGAPNVDAPAAPPPAAPRSLRLTGTVGGSLPRFSVELLARFRKPSDPRWDLFAVGASVDYLPGGLVNFGAKTTLSWLQVGPEARYFPYRWLFVGGRIGYQFSRADSEKLGSEVDYMTTSAFIAPKVGALYTFSSGFTIGGDIGATIPLFAGTTRDSDAQTDANARKASKTFGMFVMPFVSLRVGWTL